MKTLHGGSTISAIFWIILGIIIVCGIVIVVVVALQPSYKTQPSYVVVSKPTPKPFNLSFPECFDISNDAKQVYSVLSAINMEKKYSKLLDAYSLLLCQHKDFKKACSASTLDSRIATLNSWNANMYNKNAVDIVNAVTKVQNVKMGQFLVQVCDVCEQQLSNIGNDPDIHRDYKVQLVGLNSQFYRNHFDALNKLCP